MSLALAASFAPVYATLPAYLARSAVPISPRFPRDGTVTGVGGQTIGINGTTGTIVPERSAVEAAAWGATVALWSYTDQAASLGFSSPSQFVGEFVSAGIPIQGATNTSSVSVGSGPYAVDLGGSNWSAGSSGTRPALVAGQQSPLNSRITISVTLMPAADTAGTVTPKGAAAAALMATGTFGVQLDDPRGQCGYSGWRGIASSYDLTSQGIDFSASAIAGFATWLGANTTTAQRTALNLPSSTAGFDIVAWLRSNHLAAMQASPNTLQVDTNALDNYLFRTSLSSNNNRRDVILGLYNRFLRDTEQAFISSLRPNIGGGLLSHNFWQASPCEFNSWHARRGLFDFAIAETAPDYWQDISGYTIGTESWLQQREWQCARRHMNAVTYDMCGQRAFVEHKPTAPNQAPARVVVQLLRQSIMQSIMEGVSPTVPVDLFLTTNDTKDQGVTVDGYRFWGSRGSYKTCFDFIKTNAALIDSYDKCATVHVAVHNGSFPFQDGSSQARYDALLYRLAELWRRDVDYHWLAVGEADGMLPQDPDRTRETTAPIIIRVQDDADYYGHLGRLAGSKCRGWKTSVADEASGYNPVRSTSRWVRAIARYSATARRVSVHLHNYCINADGTPAPQTTTLVWNWARPTGPATVTRLGETPGTVDLSGGSAQIALTEYAIVNFAV